MRGGLRFAAAQSVRDRNAGPPALFYPPVSMRRASHSVQEVSKVEISNSMKLGVLLVIVTVLALGISIGGPKFVHFVQMQFGNKGKVELLEQCIAMPGCSIGPSDLEFYERYKTVRESEAAEKIRESDAVDDLVPE
jgi:hypothetical protein